MTWRFGSSRWVKEGYLDNRRQGKTKGEVVFAGIGTVTFDLKGNMEGQLEGKVLRFKNRFYDQMYGLDFGRNENMSAERYLKGFYKHQQGEVTRIKLERVFYMEWQSKTEGRCVIQLEKEPYFVVEEAPRIGGNVDVLASNSKSHLGIEIETGKSNVVENVKNCLRSGFDEVIVVATDKDALQIVEKNLGRARLLIRARVRVVFQDESEMVE